MTMHSPQYHCVSHSPVQGPHLFQYIFPTICQSLPLRTAVSRALALTTAAPTSPTACTHAAYVPALMSQMTTLPNRKTHDTMCIQCRSLNSHHLLSRTGTAPSDREPKTENATDSPDPSSSTFLSTCSPKAQGPILEINLNAYNFGIRIGGPESVSLRLG